jgi:hypothetical protein
VTYRSGLGAQLGIADETTYGTYVAPTRFLEFTDENMNLAIDRNESKGLRSGQNFLRTDHWQSGKRQAPGSVTMELGNKGYGVLFKHMLGTIGTTADGAGKKHTATPGDLFGKSFTAQFARSDIGATDNPFSYMGCKVADWEIGQKLDEFLTLKLGLDANDETTAQALVAATAPTETELFHWSGLVITVGGANFDAVDFNAKCVNNLKADRYFLKGSRLKKEPIQNKMRDLTGTLTGEFESLTAYNRFVNGTIAPIILTWTCVATYDTAKPFKLVMTMNNCRFDGDTPNLKAQDVIQQPLKFKALDDGSLAVVQFDYYTSDTTP